MKIPFLFRLLFLSFVFPLLAFAEEPPLKLLVAVDGKQDPLTLVLPKRGEWVSQTAVLVDHTRKVNVMPTAFTGDSEGSSFRTQLAGFVKTDKDSIDIRPSPIAASQNIMTYTKKLLSGGVSKGVCRVYQSALENDETLNRFVILRVSGTTAENEKAVMEDLMKMLGEGKVEGM